MVFHKNQKTALQQGIKFKKSMLAMCIMAMTAPTFAQEEKASDENLEEVVVTGMRQSLGSAQDIKRNSATVVDSITADDVGDFPDKSVAEALQRVAGITISRFAAPDDTAHFSAEPSGVVIRGLNQVRTEFNGRDSFSANASRGLSWGDISPELMSGVDVYKNQMAELIEGGIAGSVNMRTRVPFDQDGQKFVVNVSANHGHLSEEVGPELSGLFSNRWETDAGEFGFLASVAMSEVNKQTQSNSFGVWLPYRDIYGDVSGRPTITDEQKKYLYSIGGDGLERTNKYKELYGTDEGAYNTTLVYIPNDLWMREQDTVGERRGVSLAAQWQDNDDTLLATFQFNRSEYSAEWEEYGVGISTPGQDIERQSVFKEFHPEALNGADVGAWAGAPRPYVGEDGKATSFVFGSNGLFQSGIMTADLGWVGNNGFFPNSAGDPLLPPCYGWNGYACDTNNTARRGLELKTLTRYSDQDNMTQDFGFNVKWTPSDKLTAVFDLHYVDSTVDHYDMDVGFSSYANAAVDYTARPKVWLGLPTNVNLVTGDAVGPFANPGNYRNQYMMDHIEASEGDQLSAKADFEFHIDSGLIDSVKVGVRVADRQQLVRWSKYNWQNVANTWTENQPNYFLDSHAPSGTFTGYPEGYYESREFGSEHHDLVDTTGGGNQFQFVNMDWMKSPNKLAALGATKLGLTGGAGWDPICSNTGDRIDEVAGSCFRPSEIVDVSEETQAAYVQLNFGGDQAELFGFPFSGNLGVRVVKTDNESAGSEDLPGISAKDVECRTETTNVPVDANGDGIPDDANGDKIPDLVAVSYQTFGCLVTAEDKAFLNADTPGVGTSNPNTATASHTNVLPSFNLKIDLNDEWLARLALSKAMARPDIGYMKNYTSVGAKYPNTLTDPGWIRDPISGEITGVEMRLAGSSQNPFLKPIEANQIDIALEHYWADVGSLTATVFYKQFDNYIQSGSYEREFTSNGVTKTAQMTGPINGDGASIKGFEVAYQTFFDMLPEPFDGLGMQVNYTRIYNDGIKSSNTNNLDNGDKDSTTTGSGGRQSDLISVDRLEGLSDHGANIIAMYEKGDWSARLAYSWRSEYLVTAVDCCTLRPVWTEDTGQVDGSIRYNLNDNLQISFSGKNLLNEETITTLQVTNDKDGGKRTPYQYIINDRQFTLGLKLEY